MFTSHTVLIFDLSHPARSEDLAHVVCQDPTVRRAVIVGRTVFNGGYHRSSFSYQDAVTAVVGSAQQKG